MGTPAIFPPPRTDTYSRYVRDDHHFDDRRQAEPQASVNLYNPRAVYPPAAVKLPVNLAHAVTATPSLTSQSATSTVTQPLELQNSMSDALEQSLDSLAKLRQFKAEVEASRTSKGAVAEMEPLRLARMAESFLISQQLQHLESGSQQELRTASQSPSSPEADFKLAQGHGTEQQLTARNAMTESAGHTFDRRQEDHRSSFDEASLHFRSESYFDGGHPSDLDDDRRGPSGLPEIGDERFTRRASGSPQKRERSPSKYVASERNFVTSRFRSAPPKRRTSLEPGGQRQQYPVSRGPPTNASRDRVEQQQYSGRSLADRISSGPADAPGRRPSVTKSPAPPPYRSSRPLSPSHPYRRAPSLRRYPDPRSPAESVHASRTHVPQPVKRFDEYDNGHRRFDRVPQGTTSDRPPASVPYQSRPAGPVYNKPYLHARQRDRAPEQRVDTYASVAMGSRPRADNGGERRLPPAAASALDTDNVVETLQALKAQIAKLEKLVPATAAGPAAIPPGRDNNLITRHEAARSANKRSDQRFREEHERNQRTGYEPQPRREYERRAFDVPDSRIDPGQRGGQGGRGGRGRGGGRGSGRGRGGAYDRR